MNTYEKLFANNEEWAAEILAKDEGFFEQLAKNQTPDYLYIGCSDSRVTAETMVGLEPGEAFVHRNIANMVINTDINAMSVIDYAVVHLHVKHIIVCGHYGCGGIKAAMEPKDMGVLNPWLRNIRDVYRTHWQELEQISDPQLRNDRLVELNVEEQCLNVIKTAEVQLAYAKNGFPIVHGWVFDMKTGRIKDLKLDFVKSLHNIQAIYNLTGNDVA
jgi:carbonic anhydrase